MRKLTLLCTSCTVIALIFVVSLLLVKTPTFKVISEESTFVDFIVNDNIVYIYCIVTIDNSSPESKRFNIIGDFIDDYNGGLIKEKCIIGSEYKIANSLIYNFTVENAILS